MRSRTEKDPHVVCWYCGCPTMEPVQTWFRCKKCGTTWNETPKLGMPVMVEEPDTGDRFGRFRPVSLRDAQGNLKAKKEKDEAAKS